MDARDSNESQSRRLSIKRPWDDENPLLATSSLWRDTTLPSIDTVSVRTTSTSGSGELESSLQSQYSPKLTRSKRGRYEGFHDYDSFSPKISNLNDKVYPTQTSHSTTGERRSLQETASLSAPLTGDLGRYVNDGVQDNTTLSGSSRGLPTAQPPIWEGSDSYEQGRGVQDADLAHHQVTQNAAAALKHLARTLFSGISPHTTIKQHDYSFSCPPVYNSKDTLSWVIECLYRLNGLAETLVKTKSYDVFRNGESFLSSERTNALDGFVSSMKQSKGVEDSDGGITPFSTENLHVRRRSINTVIPHRAQSDQSPHKYSSASSTDQSSRTSSFMDPPPAPNRQLPSPPGRTLSLPTSTNLPSPLTVSDSSKPFSWIPNHFSGSGQSEAGVYSPLASATNPMEAFQARSAALQHEVSIQKIALSSLQGEHDKLLSAFSRSQVRASALEKKHAVSDNEIITLSEEKMRLQSQVIELERDVEQLAQSRDEVRKAAVQEGAQYVEIVRKASQLEELVEAERKSWKKLKADMELKITTLSGTRASGSSPEPGRELGMDGIRNKLSQSPLEVSVERNIVARPTFLALEGQSETNEELMMEILRLRNRCSEVENTLRLVREASCDMERLVEALGQARKAIMDRADKTIGEAPDRGLT